jgi:N-acetylglucosamine-6-sulfatase
MYGNSRAV